MEVFKPKDNEDSFTRALIVLYSLCSFWEKLHIKPSVEFLVVYLAKVLPQPPLDKRNRLHTFVYFKSAKKPCRLNTMVMNTSGLNKEGYVIPLTDVIELSTENVILDGSPLEDITPGNEHEWDAVINANLL